MVLVQHSSFSWSNTGIRNNNMSTRFCSRGDGSVSFRILTIKRCQSRYFNYSQTRLRLMKSIHSLCADEAPRFTQINFLHRLAGVEHKL